METPREIAQLMVDLASVGQDAAVLDTGCGKGVFLQVLKEMAFTQRHLENCEIPFLPEKTKAQISEIVREILSKNSNAQALEKELDKLFTLQK